MAKSLGGLSGGSGKGDESRIKILEREKAQREKELAVIQSIITAGKTLTAEDQKRLNLLKKESKELDDLLVKRKKEKAILVENLEDHEEIDNTLVSIGRQLGKNNDIYEATSERIARAKTAAEGIARVAKDNAKITQSDAVEMAKIGESYKSHVSIIAQIQSKMTSGILSREEGLKLMKQEAERMRDMLTSASLSAEAQEAIESHLNAVNKEAEGFVKFSEKGLSRIQSMDAVFDQFSGVPALREVNTLLKTNIKDTLAFKAAVFAVGAALGKLAYDAFGTSKKADLQIDKERVQTRIDGEAEIAKIQSDAAFIPQKIDQERLEARINSENEIARLQHESLYAAQKAANAFNHSMKEGALQFQAAAKTALFGKGLGSVNYGAAQLQLAGIGAEAIAQQMSAAGSAMGKMPSSKVASDMAVMQKRTGQSAESIAELTRMFMTTEKVTDTQALNLTEGLRAMADSAKLPLDSFMQDVAEASKEMYSYNIQSGPALAKQVAFAKSLGVNFNNIAKAGRSMVTNYKDSIKAEMQLSAALGKSVDLSEVRSKFAAGDQKGAIEALKAQGLDMENMDFFAQDLLSQTFGGLDFESIRKMASGEGAKVGELKAGSAQKAGQEFLGKTEAAQAQLQTQSAVLSAKQAEVDAELSAKIADAYLASKEYKKYLTDQSKASEEAANLATKMKDAWLQTDAYKKSLEESMKLEFTSGLEEKLYEGAAAVGGGIVSILAEKALTPILSKEAESVKGLFTKGAAESATDVASAAVEEAGGGGIKGAATDLAAQGADSLIPGAGSVVESFSEGGIKGAATDLLGEGAESLIPGAGSVAEDAAGKLEEAEAKIEETASLSEKFKDFAKNAKSILKDVGGVFKTFIKVIKDVGNELIKSVSNMLNNVLKEVKSLGTRLADTIGSVVGKVVDNVGIVLNKAVGVVGKLVDSVGSVLSKGADVVSNIGNKLASGAMKIFNTVVKGLTDASNQLPKLLGNLGKGIGSFFSGMSTGLTTFAQAMAAPTILFGLPVGLIIVGMAMGIAKALSIAGPGIKELTPLLLGLASIIGDTFVKALEKAEPIIKDIFDGIAEIITSVGDAISKIIESISSSIGKFAEMDAVALASVALSIGKLAASIAAFGVGSFVKGVGSFFGGNTFGELKDLSGYANPLIATAMAVESLANAFERLSNIDVASLNKIPWGDMKDFAKEGGNFVIAQSANKSFNVTEDTAKNIKAMSANLAKDGTVLKAFSDSLIIEKQIAKNTEATAELLAQYIVNLGQSAKVVLDGKVLNNVLYNQGQTNRVSGGQ